MKIDNKKIIYFFAIVKYTLKTYNIDMENIKKLREQTGLSQSKFADKYNISVRTLQQWEQGISSPLPSLINLIKKDINNDPELRKQYTHSNEWKICINNPFNNCEKIYPIQQKKVKKLIDDISVDKNITKIIIFGSSVTDRCNIGSDVDIYVESKKNKIKLKNVYDFEYDLWTNNTVDKRLFDEINKKGVIVYERD